MSVAANVHNYNRDYTCIFCNEIAKVEALRSMGKKQNALHNQSYIAETESLILLPDVNPIVPGHILIVTKKHMLGFAQAEKKIFEDFSKINDFLINFSSQYSNNYFFFEHGASKIIKNTGGCIDHAHIHFIPSAIDILPYIAPFSQKKVSLEPILMSSAFPENGVDYLFYQNMDGNGCIILEPKKPLPRQFVRMIMAKEYGLKEWDWRKSPLGKIQ